MKDKLTKTGHRKPYYRFMTALKGLGFSFLALLALATPVAIAAGLSAAEAQAEQTTSTVSEEPVESSEAAF